MPGVAVVGAGVAGLGAAVALRETAGVTLLEARGTVGGRAATRRRGGCVYDYGANYLKDGDPRVTSLVEDLGGDRVDVGPPVWTFDADGTVSEGRDADDHKWTYRDGLDALGRLLWDRSGAAAELGVRVTDLRPVDPGGGAGADAGSGTDAGSDTHAGSGRGTGADPGSGGDTDVGSGDGAYAGSSDGPAWTLSGVDGEGAAREFGPFDAVVLTPPGPRTAALLRRSGWDDPLAGDLAAAADAVGYRTVLSAVLHYPFGIDRPYYALVNTDRAHEVGWVSREECKPGHVPEGETLLVVQMAPDWSAAHYDDAPCAVADAAADRAAELLDDDRLADPDWFDLGRFRHALADDALDSGVRERAERRNLYLAGDWVAGEARLHAALASGLAAGDRVAGRTG